MSCPDPGGSRAFPMARGERPLPSARPFGFFPPFILCVLQKAASILDALVMVTESDGINVILLLYFMLLLLFALQYDYEYDENGERVILGKGTYGIVYAGRDLSNQVRIAIKEIPERDSRYSTSG